MRELQIFQAILKKDEENFILPEEVKTNLWKEILNVLKKNKRERGTKNEL